MSMKMDEVSVSYDTRTTTWILPRLWEGQNHEGRSLSVWGREWGCWVGALGSLTIHQLFGEVGVLFLK